MSEKHYAQTTRMLADDEKTRFTVYVWETPTKYAQRIVEHMGQFVEYRETTYHRTAELANKAACRKLKEYGLRKRTDDVLGVLRAQG